MKPFNLEEAIAGKPIVTREGKKVLFGAHNPDATVDTKIVGWVDGDYHGWCDNGRYYANNDAYEESENDLFMAEEEHEFWAIKTRGYPYTEYTLRAVHSPTSPMVRIEGAEYKKVKVIGDLPK